MDDNNTKVVDLKKLVREFSEERDWDQFHNPKDLAIGVITEASELLEIFRFKNDSEIKALLEQDKQSRRIQDELADVLFFVLRFAQKYDIDLARALEIKVKDTAKRYPIEKSRGSNKKYDEA